MNEFGITKKNQNLKFIKITFDSRIPVNQVKIQTY